MKDHLTISQSVSIDIERLTGSSWVEWADTNLEKIAGLAKGNEINEATKMIEAIVPDHIEGSKGAWATLGLYRAINQGLVKLNGIGSHKGKNYISSSCS
ncbi:hypothetical protein [Lewinella sp. W8]|uniref:hypothetical protein n=1 Tax=Lewinella sp. W8 TaxID=2528208 RepID=UPI001068BE4D|nr:hypothetical protein [Lewinella sp. W8]MTB53905.1 hypothetical protein [Lewinella sp. W8]